MKSLLCLILLSITAALLTSCTEHSQAAQPNLTTYSQPGRFQISTVWIYFGDTKGPEQRSFKIDTVTGETWTLEYTTIPFKYNSGSEKLAALGWERVDSLGQAVTNAKKFVKEIEEGSKSPKEAPLDFSKYGVPEEKP